ncbi:MAG: extracellular solute-binding protein, partial [Bacillota bacterium]
KHRFPKETIGVTPFINGEQICYVDGLWIYPTISIAAPQLEGKWRVGLIPGVERDGVLYNGSSPGSVLLGISTYSKQKEAAWEFLKWFLGSDTLATVANKVLEKGSGYMWLPANKKAMLNVNLPDDVKKTYFDQIEACVPLPYGVNAGVQFRYIVLAIQSSILQHEDSRKAILNAAEAMNSDMARRKVEYKRFLDEFDKKNAQLKKQ